MIPSDAPALTHVPHGFNIFDFDKKDDPDALVLVETVHAHLNVGGASDLALYRKQWSLLKESASGVDTSDFLAKLAADIRKPSTPGREHPGSA